MSHFYGVLNGSRGEATRCGDRRSGLRTVAASYKGCIKVHLHHTEEGKDAFYVSQDSWRGAGITQRIASGVLGEPVIPKPELVSVVEAARAHATDATRKLDAIQAALTSGIHSEADRLAAIEAIVRGA